MLLIPLDKKNAIPLYKQIVNRIADMIESGKLKEGEQLPSSRQFSQMLSVSRKTVVQAYEELWALGYLKSTSGSYTKVRKRVATVHKENRTEKKSDFEKIIGSEKSERLNSLINKFDEKSNTKLIDMNTMSLDHSIFPVKNYQKCVNKVLRDYSTSILNYGDTQGYKKLREWISGRMLTHSIDVYPEEILITNGISQAFELLLKLFTSPGDTVFVESPGYRISINLMKIYKLNIIGIPMDHEGVRLDILEKEIQKSLAAGKTPKLFYTVPTFHNPTGIVTSQKHRERLLALCSRYSIPLIEDSFEEEITYFDKKVLPIKSMDKEQIVFYLGTFSKTLFPGIRTGWVAGEKSCIEKMILLKKMSFICDNTISQASIFEFCNQGYYETFIKKVNKHYAQKMEKAIDLMEKNINIPECSWNTPGGGYLFWIKIDGDSKRESELLSLCENNGIKVAGGSEFFLSKPDSLYIRICVSSLSDEKLKKGIPLLGKSIREILKG